MVNYDFKTQKQFNEILKNLIKNENIDELQKFINSVKNDERKFVFNGVIKAEKSIQKIKAEDERMISMYSYENKLYEEGYDYIVGIDEVGRGPYAGPVTVAGVILKKADYIRYVNDSKKLNESKRIDLDEQIKARAVDYVILSKTNEDIDDFGIRNCTLQLMEDCVEHFLDKGYKNIHVLIDAERLPNLDIPQTSIIKGDAKSASIASASIVAKTYRNNLMKEYAEIYPEYGFESNDGYGSAKHFDAIVETGICNIHRKTFVKTALYNKNVKSIGNKYNISL